MSIWLFMIVSKSFYIDKGHFTYNSEKYGCLGRVTTSEERLLPDTYHYLSFLQSPLYCFCNLRRVHSQRKITFESSPGWGLGTSLSCAVYIYLQFYTYIYIIIFLLWSVSLTMYVYTLKHQHVHTSCFDILNVFPQKYYLYR